jgi:hypothetical protein
MKKMVMSLAPFAIMLLVLLVAANEHSHIAGNPGVNDFVINWTDDRNYTNIVRI